MVNRLLIYPNKYGWASAKKLKEELVNFFPKTYIIKSESNDSFHPKNNDLILNWGNSKEPNNWIWEENFVLNKPENIAKAVDKLATFMLLQANNISIPEWTTYKNEAELWKGSIVCRTILNGFGGAGISLLTANTLIDCPLYVKYKKKRHEYRVHVFNNEVIDVSWKRKKVGAEKINTFIRNYDNGWVYCRDDLLEPIGLRDIALAAISTLCLNFGAVDIIWNEKENKCYVLEVNTAPGLVGTTLEAYAKAINTVIQNKMP